MKQKELCRNVADKLYDLIDKIMIVKSENGTESLDKTAARKYKAIDEYRKAQLVAYDWSQNGLCNTHASTAKAAFGDIFPKRSDYVCVSAYDERLFSDNVSEKVESQLIDYAKAALYEAVEHELI